VKFPALVQLPPLSQRCAGFPGGGGRREWAFLLIQGWTTRIFMRETSHFSKDLEEQGIYRKNGSPVRPDHFNQSFHGPNCTAVEFIRKLWKFVRKLNLRMKKAENKRRECLDSWQPLSLRLSPRMDIPMKSFITCHCSLSRCMTSCIWHVDAVYNTKRPSYRNWVSKRSS